MKSEREDRMNSDKRFCWMIVLFVCVGLLIALPTFAANAKFDPDKMGDMSGFDPKNPISPKGDTI